MADIRPVTVELAAGDAVTRASGELRRFTPAERLGRALLVLLVAIVASAAMIPIPIVHLIGVPLVLLTGIVLAIRQAMAVARLAPLRVACPRCEAMNTIGGGLGIRRVDAPMARACESCRRPLEVRLV